jgi:hypothetical protein
MRIPGQLNNFSGPLLGNLGANGPAVSGSATGSFAANGLDKAAGIIGNFNIGNGNYKAAGIFGAGRTGNIDPTGHLNFNN